MTSPITQALIYELVNNVGLDYEQATDVIEFMSSECFLDEAQIEYLFAHLDDNEETEDDEA